MIKKILFAFLLISSFSYAQFSVKGELKPAEDFPYMILYQLQGSQQNYIAYDSIKNGKFLIRIPQDKESGMYRLIYDIKNRLFVDFIYGKENVSLILDPKNPKESVKFIESDNNRIYQDYLNKTYTIQQKMDSLQVVYFSTKDEALSKNLSKKYQETKDLLNKNQLAFEQNTTNKFASNFIKANARYNADSLIKMPSDYLKSVKDHFFDNINLKNNALLNSSFINDKINDFIFYLNNSDDTAQLKTLRKEAITVVMDKIGFEYNLAKDIQEGLLNTFTQQEDITMVNYVLNYYLQLPRTYQDVGFVNDIKAQLKTAIGMKVPNINWQENGSQKDLHNLTNAAKYIIVFWSSTCSHCLQEMPVLYDYFKDNSEVKVIAVGLEDITSKTSWQNMITQYPKFSHVFGENKWKNKYASLYGINATPSFFVLDAKKKVLGKPDDVEELKMFFKKN
jgi:thiol-disulfide isomerase/thioredoxin